MAGSPQDRTLFVGDLTSDCSESDLYPIFSIFGKVDYIIIKRMSNSYNRVGDSKHYGFVRMSTVAQAMSVLRNLMWY